MTRFPILALLAAVSLASCGTTGDVRSNPNYDALASMEESEFGASITRRRNIAHYDQAQILASSDPAVMRMLVTTRESSPDPRTYAIAEAIHIAMQRKYPLAQFRVAGHGRVEPLIDSIREQFDYVFVVDSNSDSRSYESDRTIYGTRPTGVRCKPSYVPGAIDCDDRGSESIPVGTTRTTRSIYTERFLVDYGPAERAKLMLDGDSHQEIVSVSDRTGWTMVQMITGTTDATWCDKDGNALATLASLVGAHLTSPRPDELNITIDPDSIGCNG
ncbi:hypothetical protein [Luteimonas deserti]|uniref:Lipoprotein n=1 Tax=Luteimonas deserti TaxID=2752306 RepID=A0A7Z0QQV7_9GAMM|nr:hypothetical protein [Luteimonas deserti]NYZ63176.1 hypothetical protein [Luteimonas deserti]